MAAQVDFSRLRPTEIGWKRGLMDGSADHGDTADDLALSGQVLSIFLLCPCRTSSARHNALKGSHRDKDGYVIQMA